ncbi:hypothetical protein [Crateriforma conspicua]|uniref:hypothetical protein n=1 Tax=Crateriforma conspicua TaxID=2527996 RepID=UPI00118989E2|nr:hypothetical protein [Crateriforma conspicua]QDV61973.1 hypothetical protein Mal65_11010 [Crateriforma conspicua]
MGEAARAFDDFGRPSYLPDVTPPDPEPIRQDEPWEKVHPNAMPPMMLDIRLSNGRILSHPYNNVDFIDYRDAGHLQIGIVGSRPTLVTIEGRHLGELRGLLAAGRIRWVGESDDRDCDRADSDPAIVAITIEKLPRE